jgi:hypothetical protein
MYSDPRVTRLEFTLHFQSAHASTSQQTTSRTSWLAAPDPQVINLRNWEDSERGIPILGAESEPKMRTGCWDPRILLGV